MENHSDSIFSYHESCDELRQKLLATTLELKTMENVKRELLNLLKMAYQERDEAREELQKLEAREELQKLVTKLTPSILFEVPSMMMIHAQTKANSSITESNSTSHVSSSVDSLLEAFSPQEFSNMNNNNIVESHNLGGYYLKQPSVQNMNMSVLSQKRTCDAGDQVIEYMAKGKVLPQKGNLLKAVMDAGPVLQTLHVAGPLPTWRNPPPLQNIKIPPLNVQDFVASNNNNNVNTLRKPMLAPSHYSTQPSMLNNSFQMASNANCKNLAPSRIPQSNQHLLRN
ncbi:hypothetical protein AAZX31_13G314300 [Glycine max]|uniref:Uncharacterized protein n=2 Tax=Glycine subgen. Soja TaxID=1462606 RepID=K7M3B9_SOYBN|nr:uncharacterized protein LOC100784063 [Glycine max]XP_028188780.1 uncharacterized protein LOC114375209 [Glycine soja]KAG4961324.1 hypothetical protein JHK87_037957 [Glycine soja]KAH1104645.1 hypothetical protein GYH30_038155 [Glycine max]KAH1219086.1 hypothetical protein GmHk_13G039306 [Glycine max]KHN30202.1 hypothetical protein glysoja_010580 [Glycine soja]KRH23015.1 hypothetical protein GLYMA_13G332900v4 [Glycine max]|eukprot:XP_003542020.2 uncharacterized protein LOC100784063 [Glycine max]